MRFLSLLLLLVPAAMAAKYDGMFFLKEGVDEHGNPVPIPGPKPFVLVLRSESPTHYAFSLRLGNSLRTNMVVTPGEDGADDSVRVKDVMSTMMMPPEKIFRVEQFLTNSLPKMEKVHFEDNDQTLIFAGGEARIEFTRE